MADQTKPVPRSIVVTGGPSRWDLMLAIFDKEDHKPVRFTLKIQWVSHDGNGDVKEDFSEASFPLEVLEIKVWGKSSKTLDLVLRVPFYLADGKFDLTVGTIIDIENYSPTARHGSGLVRQRL